GRRGGLHLGLWRQARQHSGPRRGELCRAAAFDAGADRRRHGRAHVTHPRRLPAHHRRRGIGGEVDAVFRQGVFAKGHAMMPFPGGMDSLANGTLLLSVAAALLYLPVQGRSPSLRRTIVKTAAVALLAVLAWIAGGPLLLVAAL